MIIRPVLAGLGALALAGCVIIDADDEDPRGHADVSDAPAPEQLYAAAIGPEAITIRVSSGGCTDRASFTPNVMRAGEGWRVAFRRAAPDRCKAFLADGVELAWSRAELGLPDGARVVVVNEVGR